MTRLKSCKPASADLADLDADTGLQAHRRSRVLRSNVSTQDPLGEHPLGHAPAGIEVERIESSLRQRLFGEASAPKLGRFTLLEPLGRGGMGSVYAAYDPQLDRKVAIKVVRPDRATERSREELHQEAKTLARVSHPNVVTVFEVGEAASGDLFIAMEFLGGGTLADWIDEQGGEPSHWSEIVRMFHTVGCGLSAAHAEGLVHRDFKPENVLIGSDGRPRVADFGLALTAERAAATAAGTPEYMAPEQRSDGTIDARTDQYSFCVALHEALFGERPATTAQGPSLALLDGASDLPRSVASALRRGLSPKPRDRFETMDGLLDEIRPRRSRSVAVIAASVVLGAAGLSAIALTDAPDPCATPRAAVDAAWSAGHESRLDGAGTAYRERVRDALDVQCKGSADPAAIACLRRSALRLSAVSRAVQAETTPPAKALEVVKRLPDPHECANPARLASEPSLPTDPQERVKRREQRDQVAAAMVEAMLGHEADALAAIESGLRSPDPVVRAEAEHVVGSVHARAVRGEPAARHLRSSALAAEATGYDWLKVTATIERAAVLAQILGRFDDATAALDAARAGVTRLGEPASLREKLQSTEGLVAFASGRAAEAVEILEAAIETIEARRGRDAVGLIQPSNVLAASHAALGQPERAYDGFERVRALVEHHYGGDHPLYARVLINLGASARDAGMLERAAAHLDEASESLRRQLGPSHPTFVQALHNLADVEEGRGHVERALALATEAVEAAERAHGQDSPELRWTLATFASTQSATGHHEAALRTLERARRLVVDAWGEDAIQLLELLEVEEMVLGRMGRADDRQRVIERARSVAKVHDAQLPDALR